MRIAIKGIATRLAFGAVMCALAIVLVWSVSAAVMAVGMLGCSDSPRAVQTGPNSACFPGPKVVAE